jgi:hypothetical protein
VFIGINQKKMGFKNKNRKSRKQLGFSSETEAANKSRSIS